MNYLKIILAMTVLFVCTNPQISKADGKSKNFHKIQSEVQQRWDGVPVNQRGTWKQYKRWENFWKPRTYPNGNFPNTMNIFNEYQQLQNSKNIKNSTLSTKWSPLGPFDEPFEDRGNGGNGRVNILRIHPENPDELWVGASTGGIWRSTDDGESWQVFDFTQFLSIGISDIAFAESDPNTVYAATGDIFGYAHSAAQNYSIGIIKTTDGGANWDVTDFQRNIDEKVLVSKLTVHPQNKNIVVAGTNSGIYKTTDGGETWEEKVTSGFFIDMEMQPFNPEQLYASTFDRGGQTGIYRSQDMGENWEKIESYGNAWRIALAVTPGNPDYVYALAARTRFQSFHSLKASTNGGDDWITASDYNNNKNYLGRFNGEGNDAKQGQGAYDLCIAVSPSQPETLFIGGINIWKGEGSGGYEFKNVSNWMGYGNPYVHADIHDLVYSRDGKTIYTTNDGGVDKSTDGGETWIGISDGLNITQFYEMGASESDPNVYIGGSQDNGTMLFKDGQWQQVLGGDGMDCEIDPQNPDRVYASLYYGDFRRSISGGKSGSYQVMINENITGEDADWTAPLDMNEDNPSTLIVGHENVWISNNFGRNGSWRKISDFGQSRLQAVAIANVNPKYMYAATHGNLYATTNGGSDWDVILHSNMSAITSIHVSPNDPERVWVTKSGYNSHDKVHEYDGESWKNISGNLPNVPVNSIIYQKNSPDRLYIGTDMGLFLTDYNSGYWKRYGSGLPNVIVNDLEINYGAKKIRAATYGRGIWEADINDCNVPKLNVEAVGDLQFCDGETVTLRYLGEHDDIVWSNGKTDKEIEVGKSGAYSVSRETDNGCIARSEAIVVDVYETPDMEINTYEDRQLCPNDTLKLRAAKGFETYEWNTGATTNTIEVVEPGEYWVKGVSEHGCVKESEIFTVYIDEPEKPTIEQDGNKLIASKAESYQWYYEGTSKFGAMDRVYEMKEGEDGIYQVETRNKSNCSAISDEYNAIVSVNELKDTEYINVHPNPGDGVFNIDMRLFRDASFDIKVVDIKGNVVKTIKNIPNSGMINKQIDITGQAAGTYYIRFAGSDDSYTFVKKVIKK